MAATRTNQGAPPVGDKTAEDNVAKSGAGARLDPFAHIVALARSAPSRPRFMAEALRGIASFFSSPYAALHIRYSAEVFHDDCHFGSTNPGFWKASLQEFLTESLSECRSRARLLKSKRGATRVAFLSSPVYDTSGPANGALALVVDGVDETTLSERLATLDALCRLASFSAAFIGQGAPSGQPSAPDRGLARAAGYSSPVELAFAITNELRNKLNCEQVALGMVRRKRIRLLSISGFDQIARQSPGVAAIQNAMEECYDADETIAYDSSGAWSQNTEIQPIFALHRRWHDVAGGAAVASIPLHLGKKTIAIVSVRNRSSKPFKAAALTDIRERTEPFMSALQLVDRAHRGLVRHIMDSARSIAGSVIEPGRWGRRVALAMLAAASCWFCFGTIAYDVAASCVVTPARLRHVAAPVDGVLAEALVVAGDRVTEGQLLCRFDDRELRQQKAQLEAEWEVLERQKDQAMSVDSPVDRRLAQASQTLVRTKLDIVESRIARTLVRAPFDGVIMSGDLRQATGAVLRQGTPLYTVAPLGTWALEIELPEFATNDMTTDLHGSFATFANPERQHEFTLTRVVPHAEVRTRRNVFVAEASIHTADSSLRPGMEGVASIHVGRRAVWWVVLHRLIDYARIAFWM